MADEVATPAPTMKKWTVRMKDGTTYHGVLAPDAATAQQKMMTGPQGPLAPLAPSMGQISPPPRAEQNMAGLSGVLKSPAALAGPLGAAALASEVGEKPGVSGREIAGDLVPLAASLIPGGRTIGRGLRTLGANVLGRGAVEAGAEAMSPTGKGPLSAGVTGAAKGVLPGLAQAGLGALLGPTKDTIQVQKAAKALKAAVSPEVGALIDPSEPAKLLSRNTVRKMDRAAGSNLDKMEESVEKALGPEFRVRTGAQAAPNLPPEIRKQLGLRAGEPVPFGKSAPGGQGQTFAEVRAEIKRLREIAKYDKQTSAATSDAAKKDAAKLEKTLLDQMPPAVAARYRAALDAHTKDMDAVRWVKGLQQENKIRGGVNPQDRPELAAADKALNRGGSMRAGLHGVLGAAEAATGRPIGAGYHLGRAADQMRGGGPLRPAQKTSTTLPAITRALGGVGTAAGQSALSRRSDDE